jgi:SAM-dependent methyltransferase
MLPESGNTANIQDLTVWEAMWAPYDLPTYQAVLDLLGPEDVVLDIGAGDLRLTRQIAKIVQRVYALEFRKDLIDRAISQLAERLPENLEIICGDARRVAFPSGVTVAVLLMRHCTHFRHYAEKLTAIACQKLITNARWGLGIEMIPLQIPRIPFQQLGIGWYACWCGATGFKAGPTAQLTPEVEAQLHEVVNCPQCPQNRVQNSK